MNSNTNWARSFELKGAPGRIALSGVHERPRLSARPKRTVRVEGPTVLQNMHYRTFWVPELSQGGTNSEPNPSHDRVFRAGRLQNAPAEHDLAYLEARKIDADALDVACARRPAKREVWDVAIRGVAAG